MPRQVLVYGHSFIDRLDRFTSASKNGWLNLGLDGTELQSRCYGVPGGTVNAGPKSLQRHTRIVESYMPDAVFLQIGGNDLSRTHTGNEYYVIRLIFNFGIQCESCDYWPIMF